MKSLTLSNLYPLPRYGHKLYQIYDIHPLQGQYLTLIKIIPGSTDEYVKLSKTRGGPFFYAVAWFSRDWKLLQVGNGIYGSDYFFQVPSTDIDPEEAYQYPPSLINMPKLIVRDVQIWNDPPCPILYVTPLWISCMNAQLEFSPLGKTKQINSTHRKLFPMIIRDAFWFDGKLWIVGVHRGFLLHVFDLKKEKIVQSLLPLQQLIKTLQKKGVDESKITLLSNSGHPIIRQESQSLDGSEDKNLLNHAKEDILKNPEGESYRMATLSAMRLLPTSFQYTIVPSKDRIYMILRNPLTVSIWSYPADKLLSVHLIEENKIPGEILSANQLYLGTGRYDPPYIRVLIETDGPLTYGDELTIFPEKALKIAEQWHSIHNGPLTPSTVIGVKDQHYVFNFDRQKGSLQTIYKIPLKLYDHRWAYRPPIRVLKKALFIPVFDIKDNDRHGLMIMRY